jgi:glycosyltransferase involved in cell wall biosynthesis
VAKINDAHPHDAAPEVTVLTSVYNGGDGLAETLRSVLDQRDCSLEYVVVNDGSTDGSGQVLDHWAAREPRLRVIHQQNQGLTRSLIVGCARARGGFIARQDVGDASFPGRFQAQAAFLRSHPAVAFVGCGHELVGPKGEQLSSVLADGEPALGAPEPGDMPRLPSPHHGCVMFRRTAYVQAGGYRPEFYFAQDADLWSRLIEQGDFASVPQVLYQVKFDLTSITARHREAQEKLRALVTQATALRAQGRSDAEVLRVAAGIRPTRGAAAADERGRHVRALAAYFVGSCLAQRNDSRARGYFLEALRHEPLNLKAWYKLLAVSFKT